MVAIPVPFIVQRNEKQIGPLDLVEDELAVCIDDRWPTTDDWRLIFGGRWSVVGGQAENGITQRSAHAIKDGCLEQEHLEMDRQLVQDLFDQVIDHKAIAAAEGGDKAGVICTVLHGERGQLQ